jgi:hypothetical protein
MLQLKVMDLIKGIFEPAAELIDEVHTSTDEKNAHKERLLTVQAAAMQVVFDYERQNLEGQQKIAEAEAKSEHKLTATWRPITMLTFLGVVVVDYLNYMTGGVSLLFTPDLAGEMWTLLEIGLGGYVVGRSGEKIAKVMKNG